MAPEEKAKQKHARFTSDVDAEESDRLSPKRPRTNSSDDSERILYVVVHDNNQNAREKVQKCIKALQNGLQRFYGDRPYELKCWPDCEDDASSENDARTFARNARAGIVLVSKVMFEEDWCGQNKAFEILMKGVERTMFPVVIEDGCDQLLNTLGIYMCDDIRYYLKSEADFVPGKVDAIVKYLTSRGVDKGPPEIKDVFLSHEWGEQRAVHERVVELNRQLKKYGVKTWLDEDEVDGLVNSSMARGIDQSRIFLVVATQRYMDKINSGNKADNCLKEFEYGMSRRFEHTVVIAFEEKMNNRTNWENSFGLRLSKTNPINMTVINDSSVRQLAETIRLYQAMPAADFVQSPAMRELWMKLHPCDSKFWIEEKANKFTEDTRIEFFQEVASWIRETTSTPKVFVFRGVAGIGKSVALAHLCMQHSSERCENDFIAASHFFRYGSSIYSSAEEALFSIIWQLSKSLKDEKSSFADFFKVNNAPYRSEREPDLSMLFKCSIIKPAQEYERRYKEHYQTSPPKKLIVLDAVDECTEAEKFINLLLDDPQWPSWLLVIISSQPDQKCARLWNRLEPRVSVFEPNAEHNDRDVRLYLSHAFSHRPNPLSIDDDVMNELVTRSNGSFLYASFLPDLVERVIKDREGEDGPRLSVHRISQYQGFFPPGLDTMLRIYFERFHQCLEERGEGSYRRLLQPVVVAREPMSVDIVAKFLPRNISDPSDFLETHAQNILCLTSMHHANISQGNDKEVTLCHKWMYEWLRTLENKDLSLNQKEGHQQLANYCKEFPSSSFSFKHRVFHLVNSNNVNDAIALLDNYTWLNEAISSQNFTSLERKQYIRKLVWDCVRLEIFGSSHGARLLSKTTLILSQNPNELAAQIIARLPEEDTSLPLYQSLVLPDLPWIRPVRVSVKPLSNSQAPSREKHSKVVLSLTANVAKSMIISTASSDSTLRVWDVRTGKCLHILEGHDTNKEIYSVAFVGNQIYSTSSDGTARIWDAETGTEMTCLRGHSQNVYCVAVEGGVVVTGSSDCSARVWDSLQGIELHKLEEHNMAVRCVAIQHKLIATGSEDQTIALWDARSGELIRKMEGHKARINTVALNDGTLTSGSADGEVFVWNPYTGRILHEIQGHNYAIRSLSIRDSTILSCDYEGVIHSWDISGNKYVERIQEITKLNDSSFPHEGRCVGLPGSKTAFTIDSKIMVCQVVGTHIVAGDYDGNVHFFEFCKDS